MGMSEREHHIKVLEKLLKETKGKIEFYSENKNIDLRKEKEIIEALGYAISSLKTDLKYDLLYEGEEVYTMDEVVSMLEELKKEIEELRLDRPLMSRGYECYGHEDKTPTVIRQECSDIIQQKIEQLKENKDV